MILDEEIEAPINSKNLKHYLSLGYKNLKCRKTTIIVPIEHLPKGSKLKVKVKCDNENCYKEQEIEYRLYLKNIEKYNIYTCSEKCAHKVGKHDRTKMKKYGDPNYNNREQFLETMNGNWSKVVKKVKQTKLKNHGDEKYNNKEKTKLTKEIKYGNPTYNNSEQTKQTNIKRYGTENYSQTKECKESVTKTWKNKTREELDETNNKRIETCLNTYGTEYSQQTECVKDKIKKSTFENYGVTSSLSSKEVREKGNQTKWEKYGDKNYNNSKQTEETNMKRYGVKNVSQNSEILEKIRKNTYTFKEYKLPSCKIVKVQGYEPWAIDSLFKEGYKESDILIGNKDIEEKIGQIWYMKENGKKSRYLPDIYIISENKIVEVKSTWTYKSKKDNIFLKRQSCLNYGFNFEFMVFNGKKHLLTENEVKNLTKS